MSERHDNNLNSSEKGRVNQNKDLRTNSEKMGDAVQTEPLKRVRKERTVINHDGGEEKTGIKNAKATNIKSDEKGENGAPQKKFEKKSEVKGKKKGRNPLKWIIPIILVAAVAVGGYLFISKKMTAAGGDNIKRYAGATQAIEAADKYVSTVNDLESAVKVLDKNMDKDNDGTMKKKREEYFYWLSEIKQKEAYQYIKNYDYLTAANVLSSAVSLNNGQEETLQKLYDTCLNFANAVEYTGAVEHVFFHSLIYDTAKTFTGDYQTNDFDDYYVTVGEFQRLLDKFYEAGYVLYDIRKLYTVNQDGTVSKNTVYVPEGKKPLVMSFDDAAYYDYMKPYGFVDGVAIKEDGSITTFIDNGDGTKTYVDDGDFQPILEAYVKNHPDFSYGGIKGLIAVTGYEGVLGYRTNELDAPDYSQRVAEAKLVADKMKEQGWYFGSHSYGHRDFYERDAAWYATDVARWEAEVKPIVGDTQIYVYPHGTNPQDWNDAKHLDMMAHGFKIFCGVYYRPQLEYHDNFVFMQRRNIDGIAFRYDRLNDIIDTTGVVDIEARPVRDPAYH